VTPPRRFSLFSQSCSFFHSVFLFNRFFFSLSPPFFLFFGPFNFFFPLFPRPGLLSACSPQAFRPFPPFQDDSPPPPFPPPLAALQFLFFLGQTLTAFFFSAVLFFLGQMPFFFLFSPGPFFRPPPWRTPFGFASLNHREVQKPPPPLFAFFPLPLTKDFLIGFFFFPFPSCCEPVFWTPPWPTVLKVCSRFFPAAASFFATAFLPGKLCFFLCCFLCFVP